MEVLTPEPPAQSPADLFARRKIVQGEAFCRLGLTHESEAVLDEAEQLVPPTRRDLQAELALTHGRCALSADRAVAKRYFTTAANLARGGDRFVEGTALLNTGWVLLHDQRYDAAIDKFAESLRVTDSPYVNEKALGNLGLTYSQLGDWRRAISLSARAERMAAAIRNIGDQESWLIDLGREHYAQLEYSEAGDSYSNALKIATARHDTDDMAICLHDLAQLALRTNDLKAAEDNVRRQQSLNLTGARSLDLLLDEGQLAKAQRQFGAAEQLLKQLSDSPSVDPVLSWKAQSDLAAVYVARGEFNLAERAFRRAITTAQTARSRIGTVAYRISFSDYAPFYDQYVKFLVSRNRLLEALAIAELGRSPTLSEGVDPKERKSFQTSLARIQRELKARQSVVLAYWLGWEESYLWVITPSQFKLFNLPPELEIEKELEAYSQEVSLPDGPEKSPTGEKLYDILLGPAATLIPQGWSAIIVPHRKLYNLNFETLVVPGDQPHYWIEDVASHNVNFLSALTNSSRPPSGGPTKKLLLVGAPVFVDKQFPLLKQAPAEMRQVASHFSAAEKTVLAGRDATPGTYLASQPDQFRYVHFVTHGTTSTVLENPLDSAIILSPDYNSVSGADPQSSYHLYGKAIMNTPLHAELVTVSACYGLGREYSGEGLVGLAWAFMRAGAHQVVAALWEVDDTSTPQLMDEFYGELTQGKSAAQALRDAKLKLLRSTDFHRPYYWASLQLYTGS